MVHPPLNHCFFFLKHVLKLSYNSSLIFNINLIYQWFIHVGSYVNPMTFAGDLGVHTGDRGQEEAWEYPNSWMVGI